MKATLIRGLAATAAGGALLAAVVLTGGPEGYAQEAKAEAKGKGPHAGVGSVHCIQCHGDGSGSGYEAYKRLGITEFITLKERSIWETKDLHSMALVNITPGKSELADRMQKVLSESPSRKGKDYFINKADECLACHAVAKDDKPVVAGAMTTDRFHADENVGVGCDACHGSVKREWVGYHFDPSWRAETPEHKKGFGQIDLRDTGSRADKCVSCHVGDKAHGKFVTHEMYAAGHPPLPPFELATYAHDAPRHYFTHREIDENYLAKLDDKAKADQYRKNLHINPGECDDARSFATGTLASFQASIKLIADVAAETKDGELIDFAVFDCWACHHDLKDPSWRQKRGYDNLTPGRPVLRNWVTLPAVLDFAGGAQGVDTKKITDAGGALTKALGDLHTTLDQTPFGDPKKVGPQAAELVKKCVDLRTDMGPIVYDPAQTEALYRKLAAHLTGKNTDHDAAQQAVWGLAAIRQDLALTGKIFAVAPTPALTPVHVRPDPEQRVPVAGARMKARMDEVGKFEPDQFLKEAREWLKVPPGK
jgi:hypothetical protein